MRKIISFLFWLLTGKTVIILTSNQAVLLDFSLSVTMHYWAKEADGKSHKSKNAILSHRNDVFMLKHEILKQQGR